MTLAFAETSLTLRDAFTQGDPNASDDGALVKTLCDNLLEGMRLGHSKNPHLLDEERHAQSELLMVVVEAFQTVLDAAAQSPEE